jgi:hypothetical protein
MAIQANFPALKPTLLLDFANTEALDPRITFTRASTATYYGTQTAMAEQNLLIRSQELGVGAWSSTNATVTANSTAAPDGTTTADTLTDDTSALAHVCAQVVTMTASLVYTQSFFLKASTNNFAVVTLSSSVTNNYISAVVNLSTGAITQTSNGTSSTFTSSSITSVGNGWYRVVITGSTTGGFTRGEVGLAPAATGNTFATNGRITYVGTGTSIFVWGAQLEQRSAATAYTVTVTEPITNYIPQLLTAASGVARFDHNPTTFESLGLLIEEQRTNLFTYSEDFSNAIWIKGNSSITSNTVIAPDGALTGDAFIENTANSTHSIFQQVASQAAGSYTFTIYVKPAGRTQFRIAQNITTEYSAIFDLSAQTVTSAVNGATGTITAVGNGWFRCSLSFTTTVSIALLMAVNLSSSGSLSYTGNGYSGIYIWGAQLEAGAFATSYIQTVASQVTRSADAASMTGANFSSWYRADEGTIYSECSFTATNQIVSSFNDGTSNNRMFTWANATTTNNFRVIAGANTQVDLSTTSSLNSYNKQAATYATNNFAFVVNGGTVGTDIVGLVPVVNRLQIGNDPSGASLFGTIKKIAYYPLRVTNAQLQALTG